MLISMTTMKLAAGFHVAHVAGEGEGQLDDAEEMLAGVLQGGAAGSEGEEENVEEDEEESDRPGDDE
jgi:hypothetical protein